MKTRLSLLALLLATLLVYWPGLGGDFIYDDRTNFEDLQRWSNGLIGWDQVVLEHSAGPLGRPLTMATFLGDTALAGVDPFAFKLTNLLLHLLTGLVVFFVGRKLAAREPNLAPRMNAAALTIAGIWLLHPMMVGTVLYAVQRMAILSTLFMLLAILAYLHGRTLLQAGQRRRRGTLWIFAGVPVITGLGALCKENALLAPLICAAIELILYSRRRQPRPNAARWFLLLGGLLPILGAAALLLIKPGIVLDGFDNRPFTLTERLLTQGRVLFDYLGQLLIPRGQQMSLFRDDYIISEGMLQPWTTVAAWTGWAMIIAAAWLARTRIPGFTAGIAIFLIGHAMESSIFPLLIYFEHRNYFPAIGVFFALAALVVHAYGRIQAQTTAGGKPLQLLLAALLLALSAATFSRASVWSSNQTLLTQSVRHYPDSRTLRMELAQLLMNQRPPNVEAARQHYRHLLDGRRASTRIVGAAGLIASSCFATNRGSLDYLENALEQPVDSIEADLLSALTALSAIVRRSECKGVPPARLAELFDAMLNSAEPRLAGKYARQLRYRAAQLYASSQQPRKAIEQLELALAFDPWDPPAAVLMLELQIAQGNLDRAKTLLARLAEQIPEADRHGQRLLEHYRRQLEKR